MPGPKPKPSAVKALHGNPGKRKPPADEPKPPAAIGDLAPPLHLSKEGAAEWRQKVPLLRTMRLLTDADLVTLEAWCSAVGDFVKADRALKRGGLVIKDRDGTHRRSPWLFVKSKAIEQMIRIGGEFGFSPASRPRLGRGGGVPAGEGAHGNPSATGAQGDTLDQFLRTDPDTPVH